MSETEAVLWSSWQARDLYVQRYLSWGMQREDFVRHIHSLFVQPHHKELKDLLLHAWWKVTGESSPERRRRAPRDPVQRFYRLLVEQESRDSFVQAFMPKPRKQFVKYIRSKFPLTHHKELRARLLQSWDDLTEAEAVPPALAESGRNAHQ